ERDLVADLQPAGGQSMFSLVLEPETFEVSVVRTEDVSRVTLRGHDLSLRVESEQERNARLVDTAGGTAGAHTVKSLMPGRVVRILVREGEQVDAGTPLLILEAMKMENEIRAAAGGQVMRILVEEGQTVGNGEALVMVE
ncbi:MAG: hypothetical protein CMJ83_22555, partial [Planctomycetes bacterium]|nr:hypothetical protein [Planctomycetota bacterium]